jgi:hypothetical protein
MLALFQPQAVALVTVVQAVKIRVKNVNHVVNFAQCYNIKQNI